MSSIRALFLLLLFSGSALASAVTLAGDVWLKVDTGELKLTVMRGETALATFENIAIGSNGVTRDKRSGDEKTPLGNFRVAEIRDSQRFVTFIAFDYPTAGQVYRACGQGDISAADCQRLDAALAAGAPVPQDTALGGFLGIHGTGEGDPAIHEGFNWTNGCIALTNEQLAALLPWIRPGTLVSVR